MARILVAWRYAGDPFGAMLYATPAKHVNGAPTWTAGRDPAQAFTFPNKFRAARWWLKRHTFARDYLRVLREGLYGHCFPDLDAPAPTQTLTDDGPRQHWRTGQYHFF